MRNASLLLLSAIGLLTVVSPALAGGAVTPEPSTMILAGAGLGALILYQRHRRSRK